MGGRAESLDRQHEVGGVRLAVEVRRVPRRLAVEVRRLAVEVRRLGHDIDGAEHRRSPRLDGVDRFLFGRLEAEEYQRGGGRE